MNKTELSYADFKIVCMKLAEDIREAHAPDRVVCISRGGLSAAHIIAKVLNVPVAFIAFYKPGVCESLGIENNGSKYIVVDDMLDQGRTIKLVREYVNKEYPHSNFVYAVVARVGTSRDVDYIGIDVEDEWIVMPNEQAEKVVIGDKNLFSEGSSRYGTGS